LAITRLNVRGGADGPGAIASWAGV
jgi:hypothetical protein